MTTHDAIKHLSYKISYYKGIDERWADSVNIDALEIAVRAMAQERKKGEWKDYPIADGCLQCSCCGVLRMGEPSNFCSWCGADMRGDKNETN